MCHIQPINSKPFLLFNIVQDMMELHFIPDTKQLFYLLIFTLGSCLFFHSLTGHTQFAIFY